MNSSKRSVVLLGEKFAARQRFDKALRKLKAMTNDFSEGSQQRWMLAMREANEARDELWMLERSAMATGDVHEKP